MSETPLGDASEDEVIVSEDSPAFTEDLPEEFDGDEEVEPDDSESPYASEESEGTEEGEDDE